MKEEMRSEHSGQVAKGRTKRLTLNKGVSSMKSQEVKVKEVRKIEKETYQNKVNFNRLRDEVSARGQGVRKEDGLENYRIFGRWYEEIEEEKWLLVVNVRTKVLVEQKQIVRFCKLKLNRNQITNSQSTMIWQVN